MSARLRPHPMLSRPEFSFLDGDFTPTFRILAAICRIGNKYQVTEAVEVAAKRITDFLWQGAFIDTLYTLRDLPTPSMSWGFYWAGHQKRHRIGMDTTDGVEAVNLFRLLGQPEIPLGALYLCCTEGPLYLRNGATREDGVVENLSDEDYARCFQALHKMTRECQWWIGVGMKTRQQNLSSCSARSQCTDQWVRMHDEWMADVYYVCTPTDLFACLGSMKAKPRTYSEHRERLCAQCMSHLDKLTYPPSLWALF
ncbi:hypothetical protein BD309DRAFT_610231 [Dichomitus squalens]|nr:hypothetical protein BD309DRAFT_610231 [Dichomitus squalens]